MSLLEIRNLTVEFGSTDKPFAAVKGVDMTLDRGRNDHLRSDEYIGPPPGEVRAGSGAAQRSPRFAPKIL